MSFISFLNNRQLGTKIRTGISTRYSLNFDNVLSRLVCYKKDVFTVQGEETDVPPFACKFRRDAQCDLLAVANEDGDISLHDTSESTQENLLKTFRAHHNAIFDICWLPDKCQLVSASGDHSAVLWDITQCRFISVFKKHAASVKSVDVCHEQSAIFATGSKDGNINIWDTREKNCPLQAKPSISICQAHCRRSVVVGRKRGHKDPISSISCVLFQDCNNLVSAGVADGAVKIWDLRKTYVINSKFLPSPKHQLCYSESKNTGFGCTSLVFDSLYKNLYGCSTSNTIFKFNCHSYAKEIVASYEGFQCATYYVKLALSSDDQYLLCGSSNDKAYIWKVSKPGVPILQLDGHVAEVTAVSWSPYDITKLITCGDDNRVLIWKTANTETATINDNVHSVANPFSGNPKNANPPSQSIDQNSVIASNSSVRRLPLGPLQTPSKPVKRVITSFFLPITPPSVQPSAKDIKNQTSINGNDALTNKLQDKNPTADPSSQVLTPSKFVNKNNVHQSPTSTLETKSSHENKNSTVDDKNAESSVLSSSLSLQNKENASTDISPETFNKTDNTGDTKRNSTPNFNKKQTDYFSKSEIHVKMLATCGDDSGNLLKKSANTETASINNDVYAVAESFSENPENASLPPHNIDQNSFITSNSAIKRSPLGPSQTPSKPLGRIITSFFSPDTPCSVQTSARDIQNQTTINGNDALSPINKLQNKSPTTDSSSQVLTPSKLVNKNNVHQLPNDISETQSSHEDKNSTPDHKNSGTSVLNSSSSIQNKENASVDISPETVNKANNTGQTKRKSATNYSTPNFKRKQTDNSNKSKRPAKMDKKPSGGKTIMNYFSVVMSSDN